MELPRPRSSDQKRAKKENCLPKLAALAATGSYWYPELPSANDSNPEPLAAVFQLALRTEGSHWTFLWEGHDAGETLFSLPGNFQTYGLGTTLLRQLDVLSKCLGFLWPLSTRVFAQRWLSSLSSLLRRKALLVERADWGQRIAHFSTSWKIEDMLETYPFNWLNPFSKAGFNELHCVQSLLENMIKIEKNRTLRGLRL